MRTTSPLLLAAAAVLVTAAAPASVSAARPRCDRLGGVTVAASEQVRLYRLNLGKSIVEFRACAYRTGRSAALSSWNPAKSATSIKPHWTYAVNGGAVAISKSYLEGDDTRAVSKELLVIWSAATRKLISPPTPLSGVRFSELIVSPKGAVAAVGNPFGGADLPDGGNGARTTSHVVLYEPGAAPPTGYNVNLWRTVSSAPSGTLSGLAASAQLLVWQQGGAVQQAPFGAGQLAPSGAE